MHDFEAVIATLGEPSLNRITLAADGHWHLPHGGAPVLHRPSGDVFSETVGAVDELEKRGSQLWAIGQAFYPSVADSITDGVVRLSLEMTEMQMEGDGVNTLYVTGGYIRACTLVSPERYGWAS